MVSSSHEARVDYVFCDDHDSVHTIDRVLVQQLTRQLRLLGVIALTHQCPGVGAVRIRVGRRCHECFVLVDVDLPEKRMKSVIDRTHGFASIDVGSTGYRHVRLNVRHRAGEIQVILSGSGYHELYRSTQLERGHGLMLHRATVDHAGLSRRYDGKGELGLDPLARLFMHERHRRTNMSGS